MKKKLRIVAKPKVEQIEVGAADDTIRIWRAKEALRQGETRLAAQAAIRTALEGRATAITGWAAASLLAATAGGFASPDWPARAAAAVAAAILFGSAGMCIFAARPRNWAITGYDPQVITTDTLGTELESLESIAAGLSPGIQANNLRLDGMGRMLRWSGWMLIAAPLGGALTYMAVRAAIPTSPVFVVKVAI